MAQVANPNPELIQKISCPGENGCEKENGGKFTQKITGGAFQKFHSMSKGDQITSLRQRATKHFEKEIKPRKESMLNQVRNEGKEMGMGLKK